MSAETKATPKFNIKTMDNRKTHECVLKLVHKKIVNADKTAAANGDQEVFGKLSNVPTVVKQGRINVNEQEQDLYKVLHVGEMHGKPQTPKEKSNADFIDPRRVVYLIDKANMRILAAMARKSVPGAHAKAAKDDEMVVLPPKKAVALAILAEHPALMSENEEERRIDVEKLEVINEAERVQKNVLARLIYDVRYKTIKQLSDIIVHDDYHIVGPSVLAVPGFAKTYESLSWKDLGVPNPYPTKKAAAPKSDSASSEKKKSSAKTEETDASSEKKKKKKKPSSLSTTSSVLDSIAAAVDDETIEKPKAEPKEKETPRKRQKTPASTAPSATTKGGSLYAELLQLAEKAKAMEAAATTSAASTDRVDYRKKAIAYNKRVKELEAANAELETAKKNVEERLQTSESNISIKSKELRIKSKEIEKAKAEALEYKTACDAAKEEIEKVKKQLAEALAKKGEEEEEEEDDSDLSSDDDDAAENEEDDDDDDEEADENEGATEEADESESAEDDENEGVAGEEESSSSSE